MGYIWVFLIVCSVIVAIYNGRIEDWCNINFDSYGAPMEHANNFYILDDNGTEMYNGKKYSLLTKIEISISVC